MSGGADWSLPTSGTGYLAVLTDLNDKDVDALTLQKTAPSNLPDGAIAWDRVNFKFKEWSTGGAAFVDMILSLVGGGTGAATAAAARTNLGLGDMATQSSSAVAITGGTIAGVTMSAAVITSGTLGLNRGGTGASLALGASGTILQSNGAAVVFGTDGSQLANLNGSNISSGTIALARLPAGVGSSQIIQATGSTGISLTGAYADLTGMSVAITPTTSAKRVRVQATLLLSAGAGLGTITTIDLQILRNGASILSLPSSMWHFDNSGTSNSGHQGYVYIDFIDSPATTSAMTYKIQGKATIGASGSAQFNSPSGTAYSSITVTEVP